MLNPPSLVPTVPMTRTRCQADEPGGTGEPVVAVGGFSGVVRVARISSS